MRLHQAWLMQGPMCDASESAVTSPAARHHALCAYAARRMDGQDGECDSSRGQQLVLQVAVGNVHCLAAPWNGATQGNGHAAGVYCSVLHTYGHAVVKGHHGEITTLLQAGIYIYGTGPMPAVCAASLCWSMLQLNLMSDDVDDDQCNSRCHVTSPHDKHTTHWQIIMQGLVIVEPRDSCGEG